jgi:pimeloyl-ACP methyl ester carboxylesterase
MKRKPGKKPRYALGSERAPLLLRVFRWSFRALGAIAPRAAAAWADSLFFRPQRYAAPARERALLAQAQRHPRTYAGKQIAVYSWGAPQAAATVLLVHGWDGRGAQLGEFVEPLLAAGYRVVTFDAPAHGKSGGRQTNIREVAALLRTLAAEFAPVHAVVAHSFGVACTMYALDQDTFATRVAALGAPGTLDGLVQKFARILLLSPDTVARLRARVEQRFGPDVWTTFSPHTLARRMRVPALIVHDQHDRDVPIEEGEMIASEWPGARFIRTRELGHRRLLRDAEVIAEITRFIGPAGSTLKHANATRART